MLSQKASLEGGDCFWLTVPEETMAKAWQEEHEANQAVRKQTDQISPHPGS